MKTYIAIGIATLLFGCTEKQPQQSVENQFPYEFHYVGKETDLPMDHDIVIYRFNRATGEAERIVYRTGIRDEEGQGVHTYIDRINLLTGVREFRKEKTVYP